MSDYTPEQLRTLKGRVLVGLNNPMPETQAAIYDAFAAALEDLSAAQAERDEAIEELAELRDGLVKAIYGQPCPTQKQWEQMQRLIDTVKWSKLREGK